MHLQDVLEHIGRAIKNGEFRRADALLAGIEAQVDPRVQAILEPLIAALRSDSLSRQGEHKEARIWSDRAFSSSEQSPLRLVALSQEASLELKAGNIIEAEALYQEALKLANEWGEDVTGANICSDLSMIAYQRGDDETASSLMHKALGVYQTQNEKSKAADCLHALGAMSRNGGDTATAVKLIGLALAHGIEDGDLQAVERRAGDLAHAQIRSSADHTYEQASKSIELAFGASRALWEKARTAERSIGARIERAAQVLNNLEVSVLVEEKGPEPLNAYVHVCCWKGRILREDMGKSAPETTGKYNRAPAGHNEDARAVVALPILLGELAPEPTALIDHFAISCGDTFCVAQIAGKDGLPDLISGRVPWPGQRSSELTTRGMTGAGQGHEARIIAASLNSEMETYINRAPYLLDSSGEANSSAIATMKEDARSLVENLSLLGRWLVPREVRLALLERRVQHVFFSPDPRLLTIPWSALILDDGVSILDQPWTFSVIPTALSLYDIPRRHETTVSRRVAIFAPDQNVNERMGGQDEIDKIVALYPSAKLFIKENATTDAIASELNAGMWIHLRTHGTLSNEVYVPKLFDGPMDHPFISGAPAVVVAICCRVGESKCRGYDPFGFMTIAERSNAAALVAPGISLDGIVARHWTESFYLALHNGKHLALAARLASRTIRKRYPHPAFWSSLSTYGDPFVFLNPSPPA